jgi:hypothetical protein
MAQSHNGNGAMNRALLAKELRALKPYAVCILAVFVMSQIFLLATESPDVQRYDPAKWLESSRSSSLVVLTLFCLLTGAGVLMQEREQGTLLFLDGLPLSRTRVFAMKALAGLIVIALCPLLDVGSDMLFDGFSRTSVDGPAPWNFAGAVELLQILAGAYLLSLAMVISFTRAWFALVSGLLLWTYLWLRQRGVHWVAWFDPYEMIGPSFSGSRVVISWRHVVAQASATVGLLVIAWLGFLSLGDRVQHATERLTRLRWMGAIGVGIRWLAPVVWIAALAQIASTSIKNQGGENESPVGEEAFSRRESVHYEFLFRTAQLETARPLIAAADGIYAKVAKFLGAPNMPGRIVVDLASPVVSHASGQTNWTKIRMPLTSQSDFHDLELILGHETVHVFIEQLSDGHASTHFNETRFFHEGLATHVELTLFGSDDDRAKNRREIAGAWSRGKVPLEQLVDDTALGKKREPFLAYPLGSVFAHVLIETQGHDAPARLLRAMARKDAPSGLKGAAFWRDTMQAAGLNYDRVAAAYDAACDAALEREKKFVESLPRLTATVRIDQGNIVVQPKFEGKAPGTIVCYTQASDPLAPQIEALQRHNDGTFSWPLQRSPTGLRYLLGWRTNGTRVPVFEPWAEFVPGS